MTSSTRGKWSAVGSIVSAPVRGYYYPGRVKAIKRPIDGSSGALYSVVFSDPLGSLDEADDHGLILDFTADQLIGRGFEPISRALLSENQKVFITHRGREVSARVVSHNEDDDVLRLIIASESQQITVKLHEVRLLPSRKSGRLQEHPDYSVLANGRRSPDEEATKTKLSGRRRTTSSSSNSLLAAEPMASHSQFQTKDHHQQHSTPSHIVSEHIDVPTQQSRKRRTSNPDVMDECTAALVLMSLSASPRSPTCFTEPPSLFKCTWPGCTHETLNCPDIEKHIRDKHLNRADGTDFDEEMPGEEEFYYTEVVLRKQPSQTTGPTLSSGPDSPVSLSEDAASNSSSTSAVMTGDNSMDSNPPSPESSNFFKSNSAFVPVYRHLEDHEYNRRPDPAGISILGSNSVRRNRKGTNTSVLSSSGASSHPINIPNMDNDSQITMSSSFGGFSGASSFSSGFGSYNSFGSSFTPLSPTRNSGSFSSSLSSGSNKYLRIGAGRGNPGTTILQTGGNPANRTSPTKRVRGESRKCRKVYGMDKKDAWCTQCKWKKACTRFLD